MELKAGDTIALFEELQQDPPGTFDVMFGGGIENFEECREYLQPYRVAETDQIEEAYRVEGMRIHHFLYYLSFYIQQQAGIPGGCAKDLG